MTMAAHRIGKAVALLFASIAAVTILQTIYFDIEPESTLLFALVSQPNVFTAVMLGIVGTGMLWTISQRER